MCHMSFSSVQKTNKKKKNYIFDFGFGPRVPIKLKEKDGGGRSNSQGDLPSLPAGTCSSTPSSTLG
ncbi:hypothetical protein BpHYR1_007237 [Brachionus plicatilis]|uniref:Uncharacterized protein n=1 Tax=Brachionus plicatilis TaxID=10195 RepID=A0A3M7QZ61_BRAPC|nr:hypothetical protein BpHYR1_007237 [Brachionus plicatilis]